MILHVASILPSTYFDGLSTLWGGCAYVASAIVAAGLVFQTVRSRPDASTFIWLLAKVFIIGLSTVFLREWLMRLNDIVMAFGSMMGVDPRTVDNRFIQFIAGKTTADPNSSVWDIIWGTESFGWLSWGVQYVVKLIGGVLLTAGWAISPIFLSFFMLRPMSGVAQKFLLGLIALVCWPFGWVMAAVVTNAMLDAASTANLLPVIVAGAPLAAPALTVLLVGSWMLISSVLAPWITTKVLLMGANPAAAFAQGVGGVMQSAFSGGVGAAVTAATGGAGAPAVIAAAALGATSAGGESAARGGGSARTTSSAIGGMSGFYSGSFQRQHAAAAEESASAQRKRADAADNFASAFSNHVNSRKSRSGFDKQPHHDDPNQAAIDIQSNAKS
jgi:type IV secretion system protein TrbL